MAIYKSSYNQKPEKEPKQKKEKPEKVRLPKEKKEWKINIKPSLVVLLVSLILFVACCFPENFLKSFLLGTFGLLTYPITLLSVFFSFVKLRKIKYSLNTSITGPDQANDSRSYDLAPLQKK